MAQAKRKRRRKHRGTQAGTIERPGRTGRGTQAETHKGSQPAKSKPQGRVVRPPSWRGSLNRAGLAAVVFGVLVVAVFHQNPVQGVVLAVVMLGIYWPMTYYTDRYLYRRRQRSQANARDGR